MVVALGSIRWIAGLGAAGLALTACTSSPHARTPQGTTGAATANSSPTQAIETNAPGDIPDNQAFVPYTAFGYTVSAPEGWARTTAPGGAVFTDKYNSVTVTETAANQAPTVASARATELPTIQSTAKGFALKSITTAPRKAGESVVITYNAYSPVNPVTGKVAIEEIQRYEFWRNGREVVLTLASPVGSDNVDPWRKITDSFAWT